MKRTKTICILTSISLALLSLSCKEKNTAEIEQPQPEEQKEEVIEVPKESPELFNMISVEGGWITIGVSEDKFSANSSEYNVSSYDLIRAHKTFVSDFMMSSSEITQDKYEEIMETNPSIHASKYRPVEIKKFTDALIFCNKLSIKENLTPCYSVKGETAPDLWDLYWGKETKDFYIFMRELSCDFNADGYRLPTEAEWMYAARSGNHNDKFIYSGSDKTSEVAVTGYNDENGRYIRAENPSEVKTMNPNKLGFYDMSGNVDELVWDYAAAFPECETVNYRGPERRDSSNAEYAILKGGSFDVMRLLEAREHVNLRREFEDYGYGFRVCRTVNSEDLQKRIKKAEESAEKDKLERIKETVYSKLVKVKPFSYMDRKDEEKFDGLFITKMPLTRDDILLISDKYRGDCNWHDSQIINYNAIRFLNEINRMLGYEPYYTITMPDENGEYKEVDEDYLFSRNLDFMISEHDIGDNHEEEFNKMKILCNQNANGFRFAKDIDLDYKRNDEERHEAKSLSYLTNITYNSRDNNFTFYMKNGLPADMEPEDLRETDGVLTEKIKYSVDYSKFYICKNIPEDKKELVQLEKVIADYSGKARIKKLEKFERLAGTSINKLMKNVKGGKALQSLDTENKEFLDVTLGAYVMSEIPMTKKIISALKGEVFQVKDSYRAEAYNANRTEDEANTPMELSWYDAAAACNLLSELYNYKKAYTFYRNTVQVDYTANGFRMPTEAEWEHAARSGTTDKSLKYGVTIDSVVYTGNRAMYRLVSNDWESYYEQLEPITVYTGKANSLGIYNLAGLCYEWCNDQQYFEYHDFGTERTGYTVSGVDTKPYYITKMPFGQVYATERIQKGYGGNYAEAADVKLSVRRTSGDYDSYSSALRLVRTSNSAEMKKLIDEHEKEHLEMLASQKSFFDENLKMISVKGRSFHKIDDWGEISNEKTESVADFEIADTEITNEMFIRVMHYNPNIDRIENRHYNDSPNAPVSNVNFEDALYFCNELSLMYGLTPFYDMEEETINEDSDGFRLPIKQEWRYAAMEANPDSKLKFSGSENKEEVAVFFTSKPQDVKTKKPNKLGLYDMSGNIAEMVHTPLQTKSGTETEDGIKTTRKQKPASGLFVVNRP